MVDTVRVVHGQGRSRQDHDCVCVCVCVCGSGGDGRCGSTGAARLDGSGLEPDGCVPHGHWRAPGSGARRGRPRHHGSRPAPGCRRLPGSRHRSIPWCSSRCRGGVAGGEARWRVHGRGRRVRHLRASPRRPGVDRRVRPCRVRHGPNRSHVALVKPARGVVRLPRRQPGRHRLSRSTRRPAGRPTDLCRSGRRAQGPSCNHRGARRAPGQWRTGGRRDGG